MQASRKQITKISSNVVSNLEIFWNKLNLNTRNFFIL